MAMQWVVRLSRASYARDNRGNVAPSSARQFTAEPLSRATVAPNKSMARDLAQAVGRGKVVLYAAELVKP